MCQAVSTISMVFALVEFKVQFVKKASLVAQLVKNPPAMWETWVRSLGWKDPLERGIPIPVFWPGAFHGLYSPWGRKEDTNTRLSLCKEKTSLVLPYCTSRRKQKAGDIDIEKSSLNFRYLSICQPIFTKKQVLFQVCYPKFLWLQLGSTQISEWKMYSFFPSRMRYNSQAIIFTI